MPSRPNSRPGSRAGSRPGTPGGKHIERPQTPVSDLHPNRAVVQNLADAYIKASSNPPNNLNLSDPREQARMHDLIGVQGTAPIADPASEDEIQRVAQLAAEWEASRGKKY
ncbi:hypothetical protein MNV49_004072 [Pseudohyphozyma bogoriensis]|nr:hypothetical protein MNV49_004072 [Pseudohyphozyma bogoriensis]